MMKAKFAVGIKFLKRIARKCRTVIFNKIIQINKTEDDIRSKSKSINNVMVHKIKMKYLEYAQSDFGEKIVLK
jgi:hypothetical protein